MIKTTIFNNYLTFFVGLILFLVVRVVVWSQFDFLADLYGGDSEYYIDVARKIFTTGVHVDSSGLYSYRAPLYPFFLSSVLAAGIKITVINIYLIQSVVLFLSYVVVLFILLRKKGK